MLLPLFLAFDNRNVAVDRKILEALSFTAQQRPVYPKTIDLPALFQNPGRYESGDRKTSCLRGLSLECASNLRQVRE